MSDLLDLNQVRAWPPQGGQAAPVSDSEHVSTPPELSLSGLVTSIVSSIDGVEKTASDTGLTSANIWRHQDAHPLILVLMLLDKYGNDCIEWHPDVLKMTLDKDKIQVSNTAWSKILATRVVLASPSPWRQWNAFHWISLALNGVSPNFVFFEKPEIGFMVVAADVMKICDPARQTSDDVDKFVAAVFRDDGLVFAPPPLDICTRELEDRKLLCTDCSAIHRDDNDVKCISCGSTSLKRMAYEFEDIKAECESLWRQRSGMPLGAALQDLPDSPAGNNAYRLLIQWDHARDVRANLARQLRMLGG